MNKYELDAALDEPMLQANGERLSWKQMMERYKGRHVYVDIWASWCAPCRVEMPNSLELKKKYKDIAFVYLSTDKVQQDWLQANSEEQLPEYQVKSIPQYFILDTNGNVIADNAPRPSDPSLEQLFDMYSN
ncbi:TlpA family protein disulfide reductase [Parapedobacter deserti]|uniref:TlpA family protein disulfide reductase n=1 Tax=Parapedobacter deserti TaxID=1912957 RepID=A0ABV7JME2_9SPHI